MRRIFFACAALASTGCAGLLGLDDFTEGEAASASTGSSGDGGAGSTTTSQGPGQPTSNGSGGAGQGGGEVDPLEVTPGGNVKVGILRARQFEANVDAIWSVEEEGGGTIDENGLYLSPDVPGTYHLLATSAADPDDQVTVTITAAPLGVRLFGGVPGGPGTLDGLPAKSRVDRVEGMVMVDGGRKLVFTESGANTVRIFDNDNDQVETIAGLPFAAGVADGTGDAARFNRPGGVAADRESSVAFVVDRANYCIRRINTLSGAVTTLAGECGARGHIDGATGAATRFEDLESIVMGPSGDRLYVCELGNQGYIRVIDVNSGATSTLTDPVIGNVWYGCRLSARYFDDVIVYPGNVGNAVIRSFRDDPTFDPGTIADIAPVPSDLYVSGMAADTGWASNDILVGSDRTIYRLDLSSPGDGFAPYIGSDATEEYVDGTLAEARLRGVTAMAANGGYSQFFFADSASTLRMIERFDDEVRTVAGKPENRIPVDGPKDVARLVSPFSLELDEAGNAYTASFGEGGDNTIRRVDGATGAISTFSGARGLDEIVDGAADEASFGFVIDLVRVGEDLYALDLIANTIRRVSLADGSVTTIAGQTGVRGYEDGIGEAALFDFEQGGGLATDGVDLYVADALNSAIRKIALATNEVTTIAGGTTGTNNGNGLAAEFLKPVGLAHEGGVLFISDYEDHVIRRMDLASGDVTTLIGLSGTPGSIDGSSATATLRSPFRLANDHIGHLYVTVLPDFDEGASEGLLIRRIDIESPEASSFAGSQALRGFSTGPLPSSLGCPAGLVVDAVGDLLFADLCDGAIGAIRPL